MFELNPWQCRQAAMLYYFSSLSYLKKVHVAVSRLVDGVVDPALDLASEQGRDAVLADARWGTRNTSQNWANNAWPILKDLQASLAKDIGSRSFEDFRTTSASSTFRGIDEFSLAWASEDEEEKYRATTAAITTAAARIDRTLDRQPTAVWNDFEFAAEFPNFVAECPKIPLFRTNTAITVETGRIPYRTGVYVSVDDPNATLQFVWAGANPCPLRPANTFNEIGMQALALVGRNKLWFDENAMLEFAIRDEYREIFEDAMLIDDHLDAELAPAAVSLEAFTLKPSRWYLVEIVAENGEDTTLQWTDDLPVEAGPRLNAGEMCAQPGYYFSPAQTGSKRFFNIGEVMPSYDSGYGRTIWQWDSIQT